MVSEVVQTEVENARMGIRVGVDEARSQETRATGSRRHSRKRR
jgi:hypothetical protein